MRLVQKYRDLTEIDQTALNEFIDKVVVHEATGGRTADRSQQIDIILISSVSLWWKIPKKNC